MQCDNWTKNNVNSKGKLVRTGLEVRDMFSGRYSRNRYQTTLIVYLLISLFHRIPEQMHQRLKNESEIPRSVKEFIYKEIKRNTMVFRYISLPAWLTMFYAIVRVSFQIIWGLTKRRKVNLFPKTTCTWKIEKYLINC